MNTLEKWQTVEDLKESLQESADFTPNQSRALTLLIELAYNVGKAEILENV